MDFSSISRALESLHRRQPPLDGSVIADADRIVTLLSNSNNNDDEASKQLYQSLQNLLEWENKSSQDEDEEALVENGGEKEEKQASEQQGKKKKRRWEPLAVGLFVAEQALQEYIKDAAAAQNHTHASVVYMEGPRVPAMTSQAQSESTSKPTATTTGLPILLSDADAYQLCQTLHETALLHLEHEEPRVRTLVAKAVGSYCRTTLFLQPQQHEGCITMRSVIYHRLTDSIHEHIVRGRDEAAENYSRSSTGALDDTTGWRALETNWQCLAALVSALGCHYLKHFQLSQQVLDDCKYSCIEHVNRHVRAAGMAVLEQWISAAAAAAKSNQNDEEKARIDALLGDPNGSLRKTTVAVLRTGLADNWSQVRMAASVLCRVFWNTQIDLAQARVAEADVAETKFVDNADSKELKQAAVWVQLQDLIPPLLPRMCLNRFYLAQGVKLYSHETWNMVFLNQQPPNGGDDPEKAANSNDDEQPSQGVRLVAANLSAVVRYYVKMCDADNHVVREAACQAISELAVCLGLSKHFHDTLQPHVTVLLQALIMCFHDESWPVRDEACLACGILCKSYPQECKAEFKTLWERWTEQLTDQIWSVRQDAAIALGDALEAYGRDIWDDLRALIAKLLPAAKEQPAMTRDQYKQHVNDPEAHTDSVLYSCGSLAPKLRKNGAGRIGCSSCGIERPKAPWEATDGCIYLLREILIKTCNSHNDDSGNPELSTKMPVLTDQELLPMMQQLADVCRVRHFPQSDDLRATLWKNLPMMAQAMGAQRFKRLYLDLFLDLLLSNLESRSASQLSKHAAGQCADELADTVGRNLFRARIQEDDHRELFDSVMRERRQQEQQEQMMMHHHHEHRVPVGGFSPFGPPTGTTTTVAPWMTTGAR